MDMDFLDLEIKSNYQIFPVDARGIDFVGYRHFLTYAKDRILYPFGYGKTYTSFDYSKITLSSDTLSKEKSITASVTVTNAGKRAGTETVQMYIQDVNGSVVRPRKQLRGFEKVILNQGESKVVSFTITEEMFRFYNIDMDYISEPGKCRVYIGKDSETDNVVEFDLV